MTHKPEQTDKEKHFKNTVTGSSTKAIPESLCSLGLVLNEGGVQNNALLGAVVGAEGLAKLRHKPLDSSISDAVVISTQQPLL